MCFKRHIISRNRHIGLKLRRQQMEKLTAYSEITPEELERSKTQDCYLPKDIDESYYEEFILKGIKDRGWIKSVYRFYKSSDYLQYILYALILSALGTALVYIAELTMVNFNSTTVFFGGSADAGAWVWAKVFYTFMFFKWYGSLSSHKVFAEQCSNYKIFYGARRLSGMPLKSPSKVITKYLIWIFIWYLAFGHSFLEGLKHGNYDMWSAAEPDVGLEWMAGFIIIYIMLNFVNIAFGAMLLCFQIINFFSGDEEMKKMMEDYKKDLLTQKLYDVLELTALVYK